MEPVLVSAADASVADPCHSDLSSKDVAARPLGGLFRFWVVILLNPTQLGIPHPRRR